MGWSLSEMQSVLHQHVSLEPRFLTRYQSFSTEDFENVRFEV